VLVRRLPLVGAALAFVLAAGIAVALIDPFAHRQALDDERLDALRGGYESAQGLVYSFGIERAVVVNGELIATTKLVIDNLGALLAGQPASVQIISQAQNVAQGTLVGATPPAPSVPTPVASAPPTAPSGTPVASAVAGASAPPQGTPSAPLANAAATPAASTHGSAAQPATASQPAASAASSGGNAAAAPPAGAAGPAATPAPGAAPAAAGTPVVSAPAAAAPTAAAPATTAAPAAVPLFIQVNAAGQVILVPNGAAIAAGVQNQANNTTIATLTQINAILSSISAYKAGVLADAAKQAAFAKP
jgi:hypothetical protein